QDIISGKVDFACSDPPMKAAVHGSGGGFLQFPVILGAVVVVYNIPGFHGHLNLTGRVLAEIYLGKVRYWDDPRILRLNPALRGVLPHKPIIAVHRSDASGTTEIFTLFLYKSSSGIWPRSLVGKVIEWPVDRAGRGLGELGNPGVASAIVSTPYSIGYLEWSYAIDKGLPVAAIENGAGRFTLPSREGIERAYASLKPPEPTGDWTGYVYNVIYSSDPESYPIVGQTFMIVPLHIRDKAKCIALKEFIGYIAGPGQGLVPRGYAPLPDVLRMRALEAASMIKCGG
ncbi:MAG: phosphate ABC transporter substrate-binding protein PstS, partial [Desulfurococcales archaeon]|nr:phosphate ABC transporter substrate-binding protein PstS [Desulfurococcales archaeon]